MSYDARTIFASLREAIESRDAEALVDLLADDAVLVVYDRDNPPSRPLQVRGRVTIGALIREELSRPVIHSIADQVIGDDRFSFTETREYPDGKRMVGATVCELRDGRIARHVVRETWDH